MVKITFLGAGSAFTHNLFKDIMLIDGLEGGIFALVDIDPVRLKLSADVIKHIIEKSGRKGWKVEASTDRREVLKGTNYVINCIEVSGVKCVKYDYEIPLKYGIDQCIGDTIGPGGIMKALRTVPSWIEILEDIKRYCPDAIVMNYTNPMSIMTLTAIRVITNPVVGLCHSVQGTSRLLASYAGIPYDEMIWKCGGINHMSWFTKLEWKGQDLYPILREKMKQKEIYEQDPVRFEIMKEFGYFVTESSGHFSEYVPYFRKRKDLIEKYCRDGYKGGSGFYAKNWPIWREDLDNKRKRILEDKEEIKLIRGLEYASDIIEAHMFNRRKSIYGSVLNTGLISNLSHTGVVEVEVIVDGRGFSPVYFGPLPLQLAALCLSNMMVFELCVEGIINKDREAIIHSMMIDPLSSAVCSPAEIRSMAEELFKAEKEYIPSWLQLQ